MRCREMAICMRASTLEIKFESEQHVENCLESLGDRVRFKLYHNLNFWDFLCIAFMVSRFLVN